MSDESDIAALIHSYAFLLDDGGTDSVAALFERSTWRTDLRPEVLRGSAEVLPVFQHLQAAAGRSRTRHLLTSVTVQVDPGGTTASSRCYWSVLRSEPGHPLSITLSGQYLDRFEKLDGGWHFVDRLVTTEFGIEGPEPD